MSMQSCGGEEDNSNLLRLSFGKHQSKKGQNYRVSIVQGSELFLSGGKKEPTNHVQMFLKKH